MTIPPIIANNPLLKLFRTDGKQEQREGADEKAPAARHHRQTPEDIVEISQAAKQKLDGARALSPENTEEPKAIAAQTRDFLLEDRNLTLGLDPAFSG